MPSIDPAPVKIDYSQYMSLESKNRKRSQLKELRPYFEIPGMISVCLLSELPIVVVLGGKRALGTVNSGWRSLWRRSARWGMGLWEMGWCVQ